MPERITCEDDVRLPEWGFGITNIVPRATPGIDTIVRDEDVAGRARLLRKIARWRPAVIALVGVTVYRALVTSARTDQYPLGVQPDVIHGARVFVLPNPSGRNANFSYGEMLAAFRSLERMNRGLRLTGR